MGRSEPRVEPVEGDRELLVMLRKRLAEAMDDPKTQPRDLASLARRLQELGRDIEAIDARESTADGDGDDGDFTPDLT